MSIPAHRPANAAARGRTPLRPRMLAGALAALLVLPGLAQVGNGGFEAIIDCPSGLGQLEHALGWYSPSAGTPDYFNACSGTGPVGVPDNQFGNEPAHGGTAYTGLLLRNSGGAQEWREYLQTALSAPLLVGGRYELRLWASLAEYSQFGTSAIGGLLSTSPVTRGDNLRFEQPPQAANPDTAHVLEKSGWQLLSMPFQADSAYGFLTIGNFLDHASTPGIPVPGGTQPRAYLYIDDVELVLSPVLQIIGNRQVCAGDSTTLTALHTNGHAWALASDPATLISTAATITVAPSATTTYLLYGDGDTAQATITVHPLPVVDLGADTTLCAGTALLLDVTATGGSYRWSDGSTGPTLVAAQPGIYWASVITVHGCTASDTIVLTHAPAPALHLGPDTTLCPGAALLLDATTPGATYHWQDGSTGAHFVADSAGTYHATATVEGCSSTDSIRVQVAPPPAIDPGRDPVLCRGGSLLLEATPANGSYLWQDGSTGPTFLVQAPGLYEVTVTAGGCTGTAALYIPVEDCAPAVVMPNVFSPNSDGRNDRFEPISVRGIASMHTRIYNRWGQVRFETDRLSVGWDGRDAAAGTYFWTVRYVGISGQSGTASGHVTLLR